MRGNKSAQLNAEKNKEKIDELRQGPKKDLFKLSRFTNKAQSKVKGTLLRNREELQSRLAMNTYQDQEENINNINEGANEEIQGNEQNE